jgi:hypothetical protein
MFVDRFRSLLKGDPRRSQPGERTETFDGTRNVSRPTTASDAVDRMKIGGKSDKVGYRIRSGKWTFPTEWCLSRTRTPTGGADVPLTDMTSESGFRVLEQAKGLVLESDDSKR